MTYQVSYTYGEVVATLTMIETPTAAAFTSDGNATEIDEQDSDKKSAKIVEADVLLVKQKPVTSKLRTTVQHIRAIGGPFARFRGLHIAIIYAFAHNVLVNLVAGHRASIVRSLVSIVASVALCRLQMTWTHSVISMPSNKRWWRRYPTFRAAKNIMLPTAVWATAQQLSVYIPTVLMLMTHETFQRPQDFGSNPEAVRKVALVQFIGIFIIFIATIILVVIPADVTLKRVQASMLPEEDEAIVPFDRTFGGKVTPVALGGSGAVSPLDAWRTFDREARLRIIRVYGKVIAIQTALVFLYGLIIIGELKLIMGGDFEKMVSNAHKSIKGEL